MQRCELHHMEIPLRCSKCGKPICSQCLVHTPVGARCKECARARRLPTYEVSPVYYLRALGAGLALGVAMGLAWGFFAPQLFLIPYLPWLVFLGMGYVIGEGVSFVVNRKRGPGLQAIAALSLVLGLALSHLVGPFFLFGLRSLFGVLALGAAIYIAISRLR